MRRERFWLHSMTPPEGSNAAPSESGLLIERLRASRGARNLLRLGLDDDIVAAAQVDRFACVPQFDPACAPHPAWRSGRGNVGWGENSEPHRHEVKRFQMNYRGEEHPQITQITRFIRSVLESARICDIGIIASLSKVADA